MKVLQRSRLLARLAGCTALTVGMAGVAATLPLSPQNAQARGTGIVFQSHVVASWGWNSDGELGDGTTTSRSRYSDIGVGNEVVQVAAGYKHALAVRSDGTVWAWGDNSHGQLGDGTDVGRTRPVQVAGLTGITQVAAGEFFSVALRSDGTVWGWGDNSHGQLGRGTVTDQEATPTRVAVLNHVTRIAAGMNFALALRSDGIVFAWGINDVGELGNSTMASSPKPVKVPGLSQVTGITAGWYAAIATENDGISAVTSVWTWGGNANGQLGDGTLIGRPIPQRVTGIPASIADIAGGGTFAAVLGTDGSVWSWGNDYNGELGITPTSTPVTRPFSTTGAGSGIVRLAAGLTYMLALKSDGTVRGWGYNLFGQLGNGSTTTSTGPVQVTGLTGVTQIAAGGAASFAVHTVPYLVGL